MYYVLLRGDSADKVCCMKHFFRTFNWKDYLFFSVCGVAYYFLIKQFLLCHDDIEYRFLYFNTGSNEVVSNFYDIIKSQIYHYNHVNGRFLVHCLVQYFLSYGGLKLFYIVSSLVFILLLMCGNYLMRHRIRKDVRVLIMSLFLCLLYLLLPHIGETYFGTVSFTCNYMYSSAIYLLYYIIYLHIRDNKINYKWYINILLFFFGIACGSWNESFSIGISGSLLIYHSVDLYINKNFKKKITLFWLVLGFGIGTLIVVLAPGNFIRASGKLLEFNVAIFRSSILHPAVWLSFLVPFLSYFLDKKRGNKYAFIHRHIVLLIAILISYIFLVVVYYVGARQITMPALFTVYITVDFLNEYASECLYRFRYIITTCCITICLLIYIPSLRYTSMLHKAQATFLQDALENRKSVVVDTDFEHINREVIRGSILRPFINVFYTTDEIYANRYVTKRISHFISDGKNDTLCQILLPEPIEIIVSKCIENNNITENFWYSSELDYYILRLPDDTDYENYQFCFRVKPTTFIQRIKYIILKNKVYTIPLCINRYFYYNGYKYFIITHHILYDTELSEMYIEYI